MSLRVEQLSIDAVDPARLGRWWAAALGWSEDDEPGEEYLVCPPDGSHRQPELLFVPDPEAKGVKNRLHLDLRPDDQDAEVQRLRGMGAVPVDIGQGEQTWVVMADPEGNEFCVLASQVTRE